MGARLVVATVVVLAMAAAGCSGKDDEQADPPKLPRPTPISRLNTDSMSLTRTSFCTRLPERAVRDAVGGNPGRGTAWRNGDKAEVAPGVDDVVHEYGCRWTRQGSTARAWMFARPMTEDLARAVITKTGTRPGCTSADGPGFGSPSQRQTCRLRDGGVRVRLAGLIGGTWVSCETSGPSGSDETTVSRRTDAWCVQVANAANSTK